VGMVGSDASHSCGISRGLRWGKDIFAMMDFIM
jgi:hypothetical protein